MLAVMGQANRLSGNLSHRMVVKFAVPIEKELEQHRLYSGARFEEKTMPLLNRMLNRLRLAVADGTAPPAPDPKTELGRYSVYSETWAFKPRMDCLTFLKRTFDESQIQNENTRLNYVFAWAAKLPVLSPIADANELLEVMAQVWGCDKEIAVTELLQEPAIVNRISIAALRQWIATLKKQGKVATHPHGKKYPKANDRIVPFAIAIPTGKYASQRNYIKGVTIPSQETLQAIKQGVVQQINASELREMMFLKSSPHPLPALFLSDRDSISVLFHQRAIATIRLKTDRDRPATGDKVLDVSQFNWQEWAAQFKLITQEMRAGKRQAWVTLRDRKTVLVFTPAN